MQRVILHGLEYKNLFKFLCKIFTITFKSHPHHSCIQSSCTQKTIKNLSISSLYLFHASIEVCITYRITGSNRFWPNFLADKRSKSRSISISRTRRGNVSAIKAKKNSYGSRVIALSSLGYKVEILRSSSRVINSIDTRKFHGDELQKPIPRPNPCDHFRFLFRTPDWREWRPCPAKKWRQRCPDFSIVIVIRLGETSVWYRQEMEYYADYDSFVVF